MKILLTGNAGFIGYHTCKSLISRGDEVIGIDSVNDYYDISLKRSRLKNLELDASKSNIEGSYRFYEINLCDQDSLQEVFNENSIDRVIHLAAQAGVRHSLTHPHDYIDNNIKAFTNILESCRHFSIDHLTYASTSSVYGANIKTPFSESDGVNHPVQLYAATKRANELMAHSYSSLFNLPTTGLRFFTVYGPWGRPDMALFQFTKNIIEDKPISIFNNGNHLRDFTYVSDIAEGIVRANDEIATKNSDWKNSLDPGTSYAPFNILNIGGSKPVELNKFIELIENSLGKKAIKDFLPLQPGDIESTCSDSTKLEKLTGFTPSTSIEEGIENFVDWYLDYYNVNV
tara:strand:- start:12563 stop:13594 length:1032 start_codon:yes stop_codon:yes gene_type:complete